MNDISMITAEELKARLDRGPIPEFWNALTDEYFSGELIPGSRRVTVDEVGREVSRRQLPKDSEIVVYCSGPTCPQSRAAAEKLAALGYTDVKLFEGGLEAWKSSGLPTGTEAGIGSGT